ncbi:MAG TPA: Ku protein [Thermoanaerobaculia bacterium]|jgi:DNA end-binding protein Ku|nr:Ku protein [Thermoanaerobaculia bacterium]
MKPIWSGHITFGLISIPVGLYSAIDASEQVSFRLLHRKDMAPIRYKKFCSKEDIEVPNDEIVKGYEVSKKKYAVIEEEELDQVQEEVGEGDRSIDVLQFVEFSSLNPLLFEKPYYLAPQKGGEKAYAVLRDALTDANRVGITRFYLRTRPLLAALLPGKKALALEVMRSFEELRDPNDLPIPASEKKSAEVKMARLLIDQMSTERWDPTQHPNEYRRALEKLLSSKRKFELKEAKQPENVVDLMEALRRSVGKAGGEAGRARPKKAKTTTRRAGAA